MTFDGNEYVSAVRAAEITGYHQDYVGQLARENRVLSRQVGSRWYVERSGIVEHKKEKDALLGAVQANSVGIVRSKNPHGLLEGHDSGPFFTYTNDEGDLIPLSQNDEVPPELPQYSPFSEGQADDSWDIPHKVSIRVLPDTLSRETKAESSQVPAPRATDREEKTRGSIDVAWTSAVIATIVVVFAVGYVSFRGGSLYTKISPDAKESASALVSEASDGFTRIIDLLEVWLVPGVLYKRSN